jgi:protease-4
VAKEKERRKRMKLREFILLVSACVMVVFAGTAIHAQAQTGIKFVLCELSGPVNEKADLYSFIYPRYLTLKEYGDLFARAKTDPDVRGIILEVSYPELGWAKMQQLRRAIADFRGSGKKVYAILDDEMLGGYLVASACDHIVLAPSGMLLIVGLRADVYYLKDLLSKLGIEADMLHIGKYKTGAETLARGSMSEEMREVLNSLLDELYDQMVQMIGEGRNLAPERVKTIVDEGPFTPPEAKSYNLVDAVEYEDDFLSDLETSYGQKIELVRDYGKKRPQFDQTSFFNIFTLFQKPQPGPSEVSKKKIALVYAVGMILPGSGEDYPFAENVVAADDLVKDLTECQKDEQIKVVVMRVDSPGGSVLASDLIWKAVNELKKEKPVVVSMSDVAGSGGYYISMSANKIVAEPGTLTGAIGVIGGKLILGELYDKIGVNKESISRGKRSHLFSETSRFTDDEREVMLAVLRHYYDMFVAKAAQGRSMSIQQMDAVAQGRPWIGTQAKERGLVDAIGGLDTAMEIARELAHIAKDEEVSVVVYPKQLGLFEFIQRMFSGQATMAHLLPLNPAELRLVLRATVCASLMRREKVLTLIPYTLRWE